MKKSLVVFYSRTGTTKRIAELVSKSIGCDIEEIVDLKNKSGVIGWLKAGREGAAKKLTKIGETFKDPSEYETIIIGTPVWAGNMSSAIRTWVSLNRKDLKNVAFFVTGGAYNKNIFGDLIGACGKEPLAKLELKTRDIVENKFVEKIKAFTKELKGA